MSNVKRSAAPTSNVKRSAAPTSNVRRLTPDERRRVIINGMVEAVKHHDTIFPSRDEIAAQCAVATSTDTIRRYFPVMEDLRNAACEADGDVARRVAAFVG